MTANVDVMQAAFWYRTGELDKARRACEKIVQADPSHFEARNLLGKIYLTQHDFVAGAGQLSAATKLKPDHVEALQNLAAAFLQLGRFGDALETYNRLLTIKPDNADALNNRGALLHKLASSEQAIESYDQALAINPRLTSAWINRALVLLEMRQHAKALESLDTALSSRKDDPDALYTRGATFEEINQYEKAIANYERIPPNAPNYGKARLALCTAQLPTLYTDEKEISERRAAYEASLIALSSEVSAWKSAGWLADGVGLKQPYYLPYQGQNDRDLQTMYGNIVCRAMAERYPQAAPKPRRSGKINVGIVSGFFREHSIWKIPIQGWLHGLDRSRFQVFGYHTGNKADAETEVARSMCDRFVHGQRPIEEWCREIATDRPHVILYPEIGMDPTSAQLAALRLSPVQCNTLGHPITSGYPTIDYFLSSDLMEPDNAQEHYSERLVLLPNISVYYDAPVLQPSAMRLENFGVRPDAIKFWCGQSLYKYLPQYDDLFPRIAKRVGRCQFVFIEFAVSTAMTDIFRARLDRAFAAHGLQASDYCVILPRMRMNDFAAASAQCDIVLDSIGWSGFNSSMECISQGLPIVTFAGPMMRGRHTTAVLKMMGLTGTIASTLDAYVETAAELATSDSRRAALRTEIAAARPRLYRDRSCISALEEFLEANARPR